MTAHPRTLTDIDTGVRQLLARRAGAGAMALPADTPLGADGVGLDSVAVVEFLVECEGAFGVEIPEEFLVEDRVTLGVVVRAIARAAGVDA